MCEKSCVSVTLRNAALFPGHGASFCSKLEQLEKMILEYCTAKCVSLELIKPSRINKVSSR